jgi:hypothetical protein
MFAAAVFDFWFYFIGLLAMGQCKKVQGSGAWCKWELEFITGFKVQSGSS